MRCVLTSNGCCFIPKAFGGCGLRKHDQLIDIVFEKDPVEACNCLSEADATTEFGLADALVLSINSSNPLFNDSITILKVQSMEKLEAMRKGRVDPGITPSLAMVTKALDGGFRVAPKELPYPRDDDLCTVASVSDPMTETATSVATGGDTEDGDLNSERQSSAATGHASKKTGESTEELHTTWLGSMLPIKVEGIRGREDMKAVLSDIESVVSNADRQMEALGCRIESFGSQMESDQRELSNPKIKTRVHKHKPLPLHFGDLDNTTDSESESYHELSEYSGAHNDPALLQGGRPIAIGCIFPFSNWALLGADPAYQLKNKIVVADTEEVEVVAVVLRPHQIQQSSDVQASLCVLNNERPSAFKRETTPDHLKKLRVTFRLKRFSTLGHCESEDGEPPFCSCLGSRVGMLPILDGW